jgi:hypothetical protein
VVHHLVGKQLHLDPVFWQVHGNDLHRDGLSKKKDYGQGQKIIIFIFVSFSYVSGLQKYNTFVY